MRDALLELHRALLDLEQRAYSESFGKPSPFELLRLLTESPQFDWLRTISRVVAEMDDLMDAQPPSSAIAVREITARIASLVRLESGSDKFKEKYRDALQQSVEVAGLHADLRRLLGAGQPTGRLGG